VLVAQSCNPSYSGGRDQEDHGSKPAQATRLYLEKTHHKKGKVETLSSNLSPEKIKNINKKNYRRMYSRPATKIYY
jgi:hypothetical protein